MTTVKFHFLHENNQPFRQNDSILVEGVGDQWCIFEWPSRMGVAQQGLAEEMMLELRSSAKELIAIVPLGRDIANVIPLIDDAMIRHEVPFAALVVKFRDQGDTFSTQQQ